MLNLFKTKIPKDNAQEVTELESWTLKWEIQGSMYKEYIIQYKSFIKHEEALEYEKQLKSCANFIGTWINTKIKKN